MAIFSDDDRNAISQAIDGLRRSYLKRNITGLSEQGFEALVAGDNKAAAALETAEQTAGLFGQGSIEELIEDLGAEIAMLNGGVQIDRRKAMQVRLEALKGPFERARCEIAQMWAPPYQGDDPKIAGFLNDGHDALDAKFGRMVAAPKAEADVFPSEAPYLCALFLKSAAPYLPQGFWGSTTALDNWEVDMMSCTDYLTLPNAQEPHSPADHVMRHQEIARNMPDVVAAFQAQGHPNFAVIAQSIADHADGRALNMIMKAEAAAREGRPMQLRQPKAGR